MHLQKKVLNLAISPLSLSKKTKNKNIFPVFYQLFVRQHALIRSFRQNPGELLKGKYITSFNLWAGTQWFGQVLKFLGQNGCFRIKYSLTFKQYSLSRMRASLCEKSELKLKDPPAPPIRFAIYLSIKRDQILSPSNIYIYTHKYTNVKCQVPKSSQIKKNNNNNDDQKKNPKRLRRIK